MRTPWSPAIFFLVLLTALPSVEASDPPDVAINPASGAIESAYSAWTGSQRDIRYLIRQGSQRTSETVSTDPDDDHRPRLVIASTGDSWVTWWRDSATPGVLVRKRDYSAGTWGSERLVSETSEASRHPVIAHDGTDAWILFELDDAGDTSVGVLHIIDEPDPIDARIVLDTTSYTSNLQLSLTAEDDHLWATWVSSSTDVGWSEYDDVAGTWGLPTYESYASDTVADAQDRIRDTVLGN